MVVTAPACTLCGSTDAVLLYAGTLKRGETLPAGFDPYSGHYQINRCRGCGVVFSAPIFDEAAVGALYTGYSEANADPDEISNVRTTMAGYYRMARRFLERKDRVLDVGCDVGLLLEVAREEGFRELTGIEPVAAAREEARKRLPDARIHSAFHGDCDLPDNHFDLIAFIHVLDHLIRPVETLERAWRQLRPGGLVLAVVHDVETPLVRLMGARYPVYNFFHTFFFSRATLARLVERCGFETVMTAPTRNCYSLAFLIERFPLAPTGLRHWASRASRSAGIGKVGLTLPIGNIGIVARKPAH